MSLEAQSEYPVTEHQASPGKGDEGDVTADDEVMYIEPDGSTSTVRCLDQ